MNILFGAAALTAAHCFFAPATAWAEDVTLRARAGGLAISGSLLGHDGTTYRVETAYGVMTIEADAVDCDGPGCPKLGRLTSTLRLGIEPWLLDLVVLPRLDAYARAEGLQLHRASPTQIELIRADWTELRLELIAPEAEPRAASPSHTPGPESLLKSGRAEAVVATAPTTGPAPGGLIAQIPLSLVTGPEAPAGMLALSALPATRSEDARWSALGLTDQPLIWHSLQAGGTLDRAAERVFGALAADPQRAADITALHKALGRDPWGIALVPDALVGDLAPRHLIESCGFALDRSALALASGDDPLALPIYWIEDGSRLPAPARRLAAYLRSGAGGAPMQLAAVSLLDMPTRLLNAGLDPNPELSAEARRQALSVLATAKRLPHTFRPGDGRAALEDLAARLSTGLAAEHEVLILGFAETSGAAPEALRRSQSRAEDLLAEIRTAVPEASDLRLTALGLGEALPLRCAESLDAKRANERIEIWLRPAP